MIKFLISGVCVCNSEVRCNYIFVGIFGWNKRNGRRNFVLGDVFLEDIGYVWIGWYDVGNFNIVIKVDRVSI